MPGSRRTACGISRRASATARGCVAPTTAPTDERPTSPTTSSPHSATSDATWCQSGRPSRQLQVLDVAARVRRLDEDEDPGPAAPRGGDERLDRLAAEIRVDRQRVGARLVPFEVRVGVGAGGGADVAALSVGDHEQPGAARVDAHLVECREPGGAERLEERELRLHRDGVRRDGVDEPAAEARDVAAKLDGQQVETRIEADDELRLLALDLGGEAVGERLHGDGHRPEK